MPEEVKFTEEELKQVQRNIDEYKINGDFVTDLCGVKLWTGRNETLTSNTWGKTNIELSSPSSAEYIAISQG